MTSFQANPEAQATAAKKFQSEVDAINKIATTAENVHLTGANAGTEYQFEGNAYHGQLKQMVDHLLKEMAKKTEWVSQTLDATAANYRKQESTNKSGITNAGQGA